jgi:2'-5' RNA ligase
MPPIVLTLRLDEQSENRIRDLRQLLHAKGLTASACRIHRPHITLGAFDVFDVTLLSVTLAQMADGLASFPVRFHFLGLFPESGTVFFATGITAALMNLHRHVLSSATRLWGAPLYPQTSLPDAWTPHCTLATGLSSETGSQVMRVCQDNWSPISGNVVALGALILPAHTDCCEALFATA